MTKVKKVISRARAVVFDSVHPSLLFFARFFRRSFTFEHSRCAEVTKLDASICEDLAVDIAVGYLLTLLIKLTAQDHAATNCKETTLSQLYFFPEEIGTLFWYPQPCNQRGRRKQFDFGWLTWILIRIHLSVYIPRGKYWGAIAPQIPKPMISLTDCQSKRNDIIRNVHSHSMCYRRMFVKIFGYVPTTKVFYPLSLTTSQKIKTWTKFNSTCEHGLCCLWKL